MKDAAASGSQGQRAAGDDPKDAGEGAGLGVHGGERAGSGAGSRANWEAKTEELRRGRGQVRLKLGKEGAEIGLKVGVVALEDGDGGSQIDRAAEASADPREGEG